MPESCSCLWCSSVREEPVSNRSQRAARSCGDALVPAKGVVVLDKGRRALPTESLKWRREMYTEKMGAVLLFPFFPTLLPRGFCLDFFSWSQVMGQIGTCGTLDASGGWWQAACPLYQVAHKSPFVVIRAQASTIERRPRSRQICQRSHSVPGVFLKATYSSLPRPARPRRPSEEKKGARMENIRHRLMPGLTNPATTVCLLTFSARTPDSLSFGVSLLTHQHGSVGFNDLHGTSSPK